MTAHIEKSPAPSLEVGKAETDLRALQFSELGVLANLTLDGEQENYAGSIEDIVRKRTDCPYPDNEHLFAIISGSTPVGFFILRETQAIPGWAPAGSITLHNLRIGSMFQGCGFGSAGLRLCFSWIARMRPSVRRLMLSVNVRNIQAINLYLKCGFTDTGRLHVGTMGPQHLLSYQIPTDGDAHVRKTRRRPP